MSDMLFLGAMKQHFLQLGQSFLAKLKRCSRPGYQTLLNGAIADSVRNKQALSVENALWRQQLIILKRLVKRPQLRWRDRALIVMLASRLMDWKRALIIIK